MEDDTGGERRDSVSRAAPRTKAKALLSGNLELTHFLAVGGMDGMKDD